jgi:hypothetical protein
MVRLLGQFSAAKNTHRSNVHHTVSTASALLSENTATSGDKAALAVSLLSFTTKVEPVPLTSTSQGGGKRPTY